MSAEYLTDDFIACAERFHDNADAIKILSGAPVLATDHAEGTVILVNPILQARRYSAHVAKDSDVSSNRTSRHHGLKGPRNL